MNFVYNIESTSKKGNKMANKSYTQSEIGQEEIPVDDPEQAKDFNSAYRKVIILLLFIRIYSW